MKHIIISLILLLSGYFLLCDCRSEIDSNPIYAISEKETDFLRFFEISNFMKNSIVYYDFREFYLCTDTGFEIIPFKLNDSEDFYHPFVGSREEGIDTVLSEKVISYSFTLPDQNSQITFYRLFALEARNLSDEVKNRFPEEIREWSHKFYADTNGVTADLTFVIRMLDAKTHETLMIIDSVGLMRNYDSYSVQHFGRDIDSVNHLVDVPNDLRGREVYLQLFPKKWGSGTFTAKLQILPNFVSTSAYNNAPPISEVNKPGEAYSKFADSLQNVYIYKVISYYDDSILNHRKMPHRKMRKNIFLRYEEEDVFVSRYFHVVVFDDEPDYSSYTILPKMSDTREDVMDYIDRFPNATVKDTTLFDSVDEFIEALKAKPASDTYHITLGKEFEADAEYFVRVVNTDGGTVDYLTLDHADIELDISNYVKGIYYAYTYKNDAPIAIDKFKIE